MGSGERIAAIVAAIGGDGKTIVTPVIKPSVLGVMFPGQRRNATNMLKWVSSSLENHIASGSHYDSWACPITGFSAGNALSSLGEDVEDVINQAKLLHCSLAMALEDDAEETASAPRKHRTESIRDYVVASVKRDLGLAADRFIVQGGVRRIEDEGRNHFLEISFEDDHRVGSVVSAYYSAADTVKKHILNSQGDLLVAANGKKKPVLYIAAPTAQAGESKRDSENAIDELEWKMKKMGVTPEIHASPDEIAASVCRQWA